MEKILKVLKSKLRRILLSFMVLVVGVSIFLLDFRECFFKTHARILLGVPTEYQAIFKEPQKIGSAQTTLTVQGDSVDGFPVSSGRYGNLYWVIFKFNRESDSLGTGKLGLGKWLNTVNGSCRREIPLSLYRLQYSLMMPRTLERVEILSGATIEVLLKSEHLVVVKTPLRRVLLLLHGRREDGQKHFIALERSLRAMNKDLQAYVILYRKNDVVYLIIMTGNEESGGRIPELFALVGPPE